MKINFLNIPIDAITMQETLACIEKAIANKYQIHHSVVNAGKVVLMQTDKELERSVLEADLINADGQSIVWAAGLLGSPLPERVAGIDLMENLVHLAAKKGYTCYFLGAKEDVINTLVKKYSDSLSPSIIAGYRNGYFKEEEEETIAINIANTNANILFVAITSPKKEIFLNKYKDHLKSVNFIMGVGGSFDVISGKVKRAPIWMQNIGMEWFYRFLQEPKRMWKRYLFLNFKFIWLILSAFILQKNDHK